MAPRENQRAASPPRLANMNKSTAPRGLHRAPAEKLRLAIASRHSRRSWLCLLLTYPSTFLRSLRSIPITGLLRSYGRSDSCPAGSSVACSQHEHRLYPGQVSLLHVTDLPIPPSPTTPQAPSAAFARYPSAHWVSCSSQVQASPFRSRLAGPDRPNRVRYPTDESFTSCCSPPRLTTTQLQSVTGRRAYAWRGLSPLWSARSQAHCGGSPTRRDASETRRTAWQGYDAPHSEMKGSTGGTVFARVSAGL